MGRGRGGAAVGLWGSAMGRPMGQELDVGLGLPYIPMGPLWGWGAPLTPMGLAVGLGLP